MSLVMIIIMVVLVTNEKLLQILLSSRGGLGNGRRVKQVLPTKNIKLEFRKIETFNVNVRQLSYNVYIHTYIRRDLHCTVKNGSP